MIFTDPTALTAGFATQITFLDGLFSLIIFSVFSVFIGYAETHFRLPGIPSRYFQKAPEIIFDLPYRCVLGKQIPLFLFVKDADQFPIKLCNIEVSIKNMHTQQTQTEIV